MLRKTRSHREARRRFNLAQQLSHVALRHFLHYSVAKENNISRQWRFTQLLDLLISSKVLESLKKINETRGKNEWRTWQIWLRHRARSSEKTAKFRANEDRFDRCTVEDELIKRGSFASPVIVTQE